jgi:hypothetical protein
LNSAVNFLRARFCFVSWSMADTVSASHLVSTEADQAHSGNLKGMDSWSLGLTLAVRCPDSRVIVLSDSEGEHGRAREVPRPSVLGPVECGRADLMAMLDSMVPARPLMSRPLNPLRPVEE